MFHPHFQLGFPFWAIHFDSSIKMVNILSKADKLDRETLFKLIKIFCDNFNPLSSTQTLEPKQNVYPHSFATH